jgi:hypothetical protein
LNLLCYGVPQSSNREMCQCGKSSVRQSHSLCRQKMNERYAKALQFVLFCCLASNWEHPSQINGSLELQRPIFSYDWDQWVEHCKLLVDLHIFKKDIWNARFRNKNWWLMLNDDKVKNLPFWVVTLRDTRNA